MTLVVEDLSKSMEIAYKTDLTFDRKPEGVLTKSKVSVYLENKSNHPVDKVTVSFVPSRHTQGMSIGDTDKDSFNFYVDTYEKGIVILGGVSVDYTDIYGKSHTQSEAIKAFIKHPKF